ncbi:MAG: NAD(P)-binding protein, partial [Candidatus Nanopelagicales bacterium]
MSEEVDVVIVGAGLAGLNAAITVQRAGRSLLVLEAADAVGGRMRTDEVDGLQLDRGFQILNPAYPELVDLGLLEELDLRPFDAGIMVALEQGIARLGDPRRRPQWLLSSVLSGVGDVSEKAKLMAAIARIWMRSSLANPVERAG